MAAPVFLVVVIAFFGSAPRLTCFRGGSSGSDAATAVITSDGEVVESIAESSAPTSPIVESSAPTSPVVGVKDTSQLNSLPFEKYDEDTSPADSKLTFWPGISIVCNFQDASEWTQMVQDLEKIPLFKEYFLPLPVESYHVTVTGFFDMFVRGKYYGEGGSLHPRHYEKFLQEEQIWQPVSTLVESARISPHLVFEKVTFGWASLLFSLVSNDPASTPEKPADLEHDGHNFLDVITEHVRTRFDTLHRKGFPKAPSSWHFTIGYCPRCTGLNLEDRVTQDIRKGLGPAQVLYETNPALHKLVLASMNRSNGATPDVLAGNTAATGQITQVTNAEEEVQDNPRLRLAIDIFITNQKEQIRDAVAKFLNARDEAHGSRELDLKPAELCRFWDMSAFNPWDGSGDGTYDGKHPHVFREMSANYLGYLFTYDRRKFWELTRAMPSEVSEQLVRFGRAHPVHSKTIIWTHQDYEEIYFNDESQAFEWHHQYQHSDNEEDSQLLYLLRHLRRLV